MGHVFVVPGDITRFACDAWLLPTDCTLHLTRGWLRTVDGLGPARDALGAEADDLRTERTVALALPRWEGPRPVLTAVPIHGVRDARDVAERVEAGLREASRVARDTRSARGRPLVAMPLFGGAGGGGDAFRGTLVRAALETARATDAEVDVALVLREERDLAQAQRLRRQEEDRWWPGLDDALREHSATLAGHAGRGRLVPFIGAGVSISAGLPTWAGLVERLTTERLSAADRAEFRQLDILDQAEILERGYADRAAFAAAVVGHTSADRYGIAPALLSGLPCREAVTLNYDQLYELAGEALGKRTAVLPEDSAALGERWLLKLHGTVTRPESIVLTRRDYLAFRSGREALSALAKALLLTRHLLFVGFGLTDDHFHEVVHDVRAVRPRRPGDPKLGTALMLSSSTLRRRLWGDDLDLVALDDGGALTDVADQARQMEIFLDHLLAHTDAGPGHLLDDRFAMLLTPPERRLADRLRRVAAEMGDDELSTIAGRAVRDFLDRLGDSARR
ncbi:MULTISPECIES: SIR2 family protein [unclassified Pseudonocardia]|uniref:SIR2 family NAD-dependent protein deacylase n=1 Tax=unclassified Pseudonocardia TaxID=2619320 RepID=UPI001CF6CF98|nr:SIR2 family protein [Pseudonocardia sp. ICBG601]